MANSTGTCMWISNSAGLRCYSFLLCLLVLKFIMNPKKFIFMLQNCASSSFINPWVHLSSDNWRKYKNMLKCAVSILLSLLVMGAKYFELLFCLFVFWGEEVLFHKALLWWYSTMRHLWCGKITSYLTKGSLVPKDLH